MHSSGRHGVLRPCERVEVLALIDRKYEPQFNHGDAEDDGAFQEAPPALDPSDPDRATRNLDERPHELALLVHLEDDDPPVGEQHWQVLRRQLPQKICETRADDRDIRLWSIPTRPHHHPHPPPPTSQPSP